MNDRRMASTCLEALAWVAADRDDPRVTVVLLAAADAVGRSVGCPTIVFPNMAVHHKEAERRAREALDGQAFDAARHEGASQSFDAAVAYAVDD